MNKALFASMREQMRPSEDARAALDEKLANTRCTAFPMKRYAAIAACVMVIAAAVPVGWTVWKYGKWQAIVDNFRTADVRRAENPHSYVLAELPDGCLPGNSVTTDTGGTGDGDMDMSPDEVADNMLGAGFSQEDVDAYLASGWQMTWAKWWKFYHMSEESGEWTLDALLAFSRTEMLAVNTGEAFEEIPGGAFVGDTLGQGGAVLAYQNLMAKFETDYGPDRYPDWYGGAYIDEHTGLIVNIVEDCEPEDKELFLDIWDWAGSDKVGFSSSQWSLNQLRVLQSNVMEEMERLGVPAGCGIDEENGRVDLDLPWADDEILWKLAELDPADTAVLVRVGYYAENTPGMEETPSAARSPVRPGGADGPGAVDNAAPLD